MTGAFALVPVGKTRRDWGRDATYRPLLSKPLGRMMKGAKTTAYMAGMWVLQYFLVT